MGKSEINFIWILRWNLMKPEPLRKYHWWLWWDSEWESQREISKSQIGNCIRKIIGQIKKIDGRFYSRFSILIMNPEYLAIAGIFFASFFVLADNWTGINSPEIFVFYIFFSHTHTQKQQSCFRFYFFSNFWSSSFRGERNQIR